ncbi:cytochrome P450 2A13-like [Sciurus carolinensis]|uniref:cytochrome P450 2A13-like n=1 Tax=Sciurus carolinensis TaxID=30640 RepID=UPI001FB3DC8C|nr:cytochrome P450 2A13-like [Sciurus carolinensis]
MVKESLVDQTEEFSGRGQQATFDHLFKGYGVAFSNGERTKQLKRFCLHVLRELGVGKRGTEHRIQQEADFLIEALQSTRAKVREETDQVIGRNRQPSCGDRTKMPYTQAVIHEIQRFANVGPFAMAHRVTKDTRFRDFFLPKGTDVIYMLGSLLIDPRIFSTPDDFKPQHFLDDKGLKKVDAHVPFSMGKKSCLGEGLATMELFLFLTSIMQNFCFKCSPEPQDIKLSLNHEDFARVPPNFTMSFLPR